MPFKVIMIPMSLSNVYEMVIKWLLHTYCLFNDCGGLVEGGGRGLFLQQWQDILDQVSLTRSRLSSMGNGGK